MQNLDATRMGGQKKHHHTSVPTRTLVTTCQHGLQNRERDQKRHTLHLKSCFQNGYLREFPLRYATNTSVELLPAASLCFSIDLAIDQSINLSIYLSHLPSWLCARLPFRASAVCRIFFLLTLSLLFFSRLIFLSSLPLPCFPYYLSIFGEV